MVSDVNKEPAVKISFVALSALLIRRPLAVSAPSATRCAHADVATGVSGSRNRNRVLLSTVVLVARRRAVRPVLARRRAAHVGLPAARVATLLGAGSEAKAKADGYSSRS